MAITKIFSIKKTLHKAIKYITNSQKTDSGSLIYSYQCGMYTADLEMELISRQNKNFNRKNDRKAYHMIQSFAPDDNVTPEQALEIGKQLAEKYTYGNHQYIVTTHIDKGHIHNHIIFNATDFVNCKKMHIKDKDLDRMRDINDKLCKENGLSVIEKKSGVKGRGKYEYEQHKKGNAWKDKLREAIDRTILESEDFDDFITRMEMEEGYEIKTGKYLSFRMEGQERFTRNRTLGDNYSIDAIKFRIANKDKAVYRETIHKDQDEKTSSKKTSSVKKEHRSKYQDDSHIYLISKIEEKLSSLDAGKPEAYRNALIRSEINNLVKSQEFLIRNKINTPEEFQKHYAGIVSDFNKTASQQKIVRNDILNLEMEIRQLQNYQEGKAAFKEFVSLRNKTEFVTDEKKYAKKINYDVAKRYFNEIVKTNPDKLSIDDLYKQKENLMKKSGQMPEQRNNLFQTKKELEIIAANIKASLEIDLLDESGRSDTDKQRNSYLKK